MELIACSSSTSRFLSQNVDLTYTSFSKAYFRCAVKRIMDASTDMGLT